MDTRQPPIVLVFAGNDPSGGAGLCADIQALASMNCHTAPIVTCITQQDTCHLRASLPLSGEQVAAQAEIVLADMPIAACKIGLLGTVEIVEAIQQVLLKYPDIPVILDPVLAAGGGGESLIKGNVADAIVNKLLPLTKIVTPNSVEARTLAKKTHSLDAAAAQLIDYGCEYVCITGTHEDTDFVINSLYTSNNKEEPIIKSWSWQRLPHTYHGSGCTYAASLAGLLAQGKDMLTAVYDAQLYTWTSLQRGYQAGHGQALPNRLI